MSITLALLTFVGIVRPQRQTSQRPPMPPYDPKFGNVDVRERGQWTYDVSGPDFWKQKPDRSEPPAMSLADWITFLPREKQLRAFRLLRNGYGNALVMA